MSSTQAWKYHRAFPFCAAEKTSSQIDAIEGNAYYTPSTDPQSGLLKFANIGDPMEIWWLIETVYYELDFDGATENATLGIVDINDETEKEPYERVCAESEGISYLKDDGAADFRFDSIYYNTDESEYWLFFRIAPEYSGGGFVHTATAELGSTANTFTISMFGQTQTLYADDARLSMSDFSHTLYTVT